MTLTTSLRKYIHRELETIFGGLLRTGKHFWREDLNPLTRDFVRWSVSSMDTSVFFSEGSSRPGSTRNSNASEIRSSSINPEVPESSQKALHLPKKRSMAALRASAGSEQSDVIAQEDSGTNNREVKKQ